MKAVERGRQDWVVVFIILFLGFVLVILAGQFALRFAPSWQMDTNMDSHLDPNSAFLTRRPSGFVEPIDAAILTQPSWMNEFLTPGVTITTRTAFPPHTPTFSTPLTVVPSLTNTVLPTKSLTSTVVYSAVTRTPTSRPGSTATRAPTSRPSSTATWTLTAPSTSVATKTLTSTTISPTVTATRTPNLIVTPSSSPTLTRTPTVTATQTATATMTATATSSPTATMSPTGTYTATSTSTPTNPYPPEIGTTPDGVVYPLPTGGSLVLSINLVADGDANYDLVYYERPAPTGGINLDWVIVEIGDGTNWYQVFNWGNNIADINSNMDFNILPNPQVPPETDQRNIPGSSLYNSTGVAINVDAMVPTGTYTYIRFSAPPGDSDGQTEIDAVAVLP